MLSLVNINHENINQLLSQGEIDKADNLLSYEQYSQVDTDRIEEENPYILLDTLLKTDENSIIFLEDTLFSKFSNILIQITNKYSNPEYQLLGARDKVLGTYINTYTHIDLDDTLKSLYEMQEEIKNSVNADMVLVLDNPNNQTIKLLKYALNKRPNKTPILLLKNDYYYLDSLINLLKMDMTDISRVILANKLSYVQDGLILLSEPYMVPSPMEFHELTLDFYQRFINADIINGSNNECDYHPCHYPSQNCALCYCPFYPCGDHSTGGKWIKDKDIWDCSDCIWIHTDEAVNCVLKGLDTLLESVDDLRDNRMDLLKLRRECILRL